MFRGKFNGALFAKALLTGAIFAWGWGVHSASAGTIVGWNVYGAGPSGAASNLAPTDVAGAPGFAQANWNNHQTNGQGVGSLPRALNDNDGQASGISLTGWTQSAANSWAMGDIANADQKLMNVYVANDAVLTFSNVHGFTPDGYTVVLYYGRNGDNAVSAAFNVNGQTQEVNFFRNTTKHSVAGYVLNDNGQGNSNYAVFENVTGDTLTISFSPAANNFGLHAVQIVQTIPEPAGLGMAGLAGLLMLRRRRRAFAG